MSRNTEVAAGIPEAAGFPPVGPVPCSDTECWVVPHAAGALADGAFVHARHAGGSLTDGAYPEVPTVFRP